MSRLYADEDFDHRVVAALRALGHDMLTVMDARRRGLCDSDQLAFAAESGRILITFNRSDFHALHRAGTVHAGIVTCTRDPDIAALVARIHVVLADRETAPGVLLQVIRGHR